MFEERETFEGSPGTKENFSIRVGELPNGSPYLVPVMVVSGREDGPTLFVNAAMHGDEVLGADVVRRTVKALKPDEMRGRLITVPMANHAAVATRTRRNITEMYPGPHDMNRVFPGSPRGIITERLAALLMDRFIKHSDYSFDLHAASVGGLWEPYASIPSRDECSSEEVCERSAGLAKAFGTELLLDGATIEGSLTAAAASSGSPASSAEFGVANQIDHDERAMGLRGLTNLMKHVGILDGSPELPSDRFIAKEITRVRTDRGGFLNLHLRLGDMVRSGQLIAEVEDLAGDVVQSLESPADGRICRINTMPVVGTGDLVVYVASE